MHSYKIVFCGVLFLFTATAQSQIMAISEKGDTVYLFNDGTWSFSPDFGKEVFEELSFLDMELDIQDNPEVFMVPDKSDKEVNFNDKIVIHYNSSDWDRTPPGLYNAEAEFAWTSKNEDFYCITIIEEVGLGLENIVKIAIDNLNASSSDEVEIIKLQRRTVNNKELILGVFKLDIKGMDITYCGYYYSDGEFTIQHLTYTHSSIFDQKLPEMMDLLNGLVIK